VGEVKIVNCRPTFSIAAASLQSARALDGLPAQHDSGKEPFAAFIRPFAE
jgi:hypothetical protein